MAMTNNDSRNNDELVVQTQIAEINSCITI